MIIHNEDFPFNELRKHDGDYYQNQRELEGEIYYEETVRTAAEIAEL